MFWIPQDLVGVWESHALPKANSAQAAVWQNRKLRLKSDGTFTIYGLDATGKWSIQRDRLILIPNRVFGQSTGTPLHQLMGQKIVISVHKGGLGSALWSPNPQPFPIRWNRVVRPRVPTLLRMLDNEEDLENLEYAFEELKEGGPDVANELAYGLQHSPGLGRSFWLLTFLERHSGSRGMVELLNALDSLNPRIAGTAARLLGEAGDPIAFHPLVDYMARRPKDRATAIGAIAKLETDQAIRILVEELQRPRSEYGTIYALRGLAARKEKTYRALFLRYANDPRAKVQTAALAGLSMLGPLSSKELADVQRTAQLGDWAARIDAVKLLGETRSGYDLLVRLTDDNDWVVRREAVNGIAKFGPVRDGPVRVKLQRLLWDGSFDVRNAAGKALRRR